MIEGLLVLTILKTLDIIPGSCGRDERMARKAILIVRVCVECVWRALSVNLGMHVVLFECDRVLYCEWMFLFYVLPQKVVRVRTVGDYAVSESKFLVF